MSELISSRSGKGEGDDPINSSAEEFSEALDRKAEIAKAKRNTVSRILLWHSEVDNYLQQFRSRRQDVERMRPGYDQNEPFNIARARLWNVIGRCEGSLRNITALLKLLETDWKARDWCGKYEVWMDLNIEVTQRDIQSIAEKLSSLEELNLMDEDTERQKRLGIIIRDLAVDFDHCWTLAREIVFWANSVQEMVWNERKMMEWLAPTPYKPPTG